MDSFGSFTQCIVDGDAESRRGKRKLRGFGFALSVTVQLAILIALILVPILTAAMLPKLLSVVQIPVYRPRPVVDQAPVTHARTVTQPAYIPSVTSRPSFSRNHVESTVTPIGETPTLDFGGNYKSTDILGVASRPPIPPPPREETHAPVKIASGVMQALLINRVEPSYPTIAKRAHASGAVVISAVIAMDGTIQSLHVVSGKSAAGGSGARCGEAVALQADNA